MKRLKKEEAPVEKSKVEDVVPEVKVVEEVKPSGKIRWKKIGGGSLRLQIGGTNRIIKPGEVFTALPGEIPMPFRDTVIPLEQIKEPEPTKSVAIKSDYKIVPRGKSKSLFDILDGQGKLVNDKSKPLPKAVAEQYVRDLTK